MSILNRILIECKKKNISIKALEKELNFGNGTIRRWDDNSPACDRVLKVANFLNVDFEWLCTGTSKHLINLNNDVLTFLNSYNNLCESDKVKIKNFIEIASPQIKEESMLKNDFHVENSVEYNSIPVLGYVAAGSPILAVENILTFINTPLSVQFALYAKGDSMEPVILNGEIIYIKKTTYISNKEIGIFQINEEVTCKVFYEYEDRIELHSLNIKYSPMIYYKDQNLNFNVIGKVILADEQQKRLDSFEKFT